MYEIILILFLFFDRNVLLLCNHVVNQGVYKLCFYSIIFIIIWKDIIIFAILILSQVFDCLLVVLPSFKINCNKNEHDINVCVIFLFLFFNIIPNHLFIHIIIIFFQILNVNANFLTKFLKQSNAVLCIRFHGLIFC